MCGQRLSLKSLQYCVDLVGMNFRYSAIWTAILFALSAVLSLIPAVRSIIIYISKKISIVLETLNFSVFNRKRVKLNRIEKMPPPAVLSDLFLRLQVYVLGGKLWLS